MDIQQIKWVQARLTAHGFQCGLIDGIAGAVTKRAISGFQERYQLTVTGEINTALIKALQAEPVASPSEMANIPDRDALLSDDQDRWDVKHRWPLQKMAHTFYGEPGAHQVQLALPFPMYLAWDRSTEIHKITLHEKCHDSAGRALAEIAALYSPGERLALGINIFGGSLAIRNMRGGKSVSMHAYGAALDFNPEYNQLAWHRPKAGLSHDEAVPFWQAWEKEGWVSLGREKDFDWMHVQAARLT